MAGLDLEGCVHFGGGTGRGAWPVGLFGEVRRQAEQRGKKVDRCEEVRQSRAGLLERARVMGVPRIWSLGGRDRQELWVFRQGPIA